MNVAIPATPGAWVLGSRPADCRFGSVTYPRSDDQSTTSRDADFQRLTTDIAEAIEDAEIDYGTNVVESTLDYALSLLGLALDSYGRFSHLLEAIVFPNGEIGLQWYRDPNNVITLSVAQDGRVAWARQLKGKAANGDSYLLGQIPRDCDAALSEFFKSA